MGRNSWLNLFIFLLVISLSIRFGIRLLMFGLRYWYITLPVFLIYFYIIKPKKLKNEQHSHQTNHHQNNNEIYLDPKDYKTTDIDDVEDTDN